ncbi:unnamed protein product [Ectocarpus sp. CCAP 1310/34]|nr:unnamed protein product [Ectocarpus sp. CCAP 1310/34]
MAMATTPDGAGRYPLPPTARFGGQMRLAGAPAMDSLGPGRIVPSHGYEDGGRASTGGSFPHAIGAPALPPLCFPDGIASSFAPGEGGQDSCLDPHVAAAAAAETAAGAAALGHDLDEGMFLPSGGGGGASALPPLWADAGVGDAGGGGFLLESWPSKIGP